MDHDNNTLEVVKQKRKKSLRNTLISVVSFAFITIVFFSAHTYAYYTDEVNSKKQSLEAGNLDVELIEMKKTDSGETAYVNPVEIMPATSVSKIVKVKNSGSLPVYIRIKIEKTINKDESKLPHDWKELLSCDFDLEDNPSTEEVEGAWTYHDGYYYYNLPLAAGETTSPLFENVFFSAFMGNEFTNCEISFIVRCEATQTIGNASSPIDAIGWPYDDTEESTETSEAGETETTEETGH